MRPTRRRAAAALAFAAGGPAVIGRAQTAWSPTQPVRLIIPFTPGGTMDPVARIAQTALQQDLGQPVVIDHKPGGSTGPCCTDNSVH
jgi:tripartite-type tricarboxylate transporter receptor subunit TctC